MAKMTLWKGLILSGLSLFCLGAQAAETAHPLDKALQTCLDTHHSTVGMQDCYRENQAQWDQAMNQYYQALGGDGNPELRRAQVAWLKYRDLEFKRIEKKYQDMHQKSQGGTIWGLMAGREKLEVVRSRSLLLYDTQRLLTCGLACD